MLVRESGAHFGVHEFNFPVMDIRIAHAVSIVEAPCLIQFAFGKTVKIAVRIQPVGFRKNNPAPLRIFGGLRGIGETR